MISKDNLSLSDSVVIRYASGNLGKSLFWTSLEYLLLFYMTDIVGISPAWAGIIIVVSLVWDGVTDPLMGYWTDRRTARGHDYWLYLFWGPPLCALGFATIFYVPFESEIAKAIYLMIANLLFRTLYTLFDVPHNALLAKLPASPYQRTRISAWRYFFSSLGGLSVALATAVLFGEQRQHPAIFLIFAFAVGVVACATIWQSLGLAQSLGKTAARNLTSEHPAMTPREFITTICAAPIAVRFFAIVVLNALALPLFARMAPYIAKYRIADEAWAGALFAALVLGQMVAMPCWTWIGRYVDKSSCCAFAYLLLVCVLLVAIISAPTSPLAYVCIAALVGFAVGVLNMLIWALAPDVVDRVEQAEKVRPNAMFMSSLTLVQKSSVGLGSLLAGIGLSASGFEAGQPQDSLALFGISALAFGVPLLGAVLGIVIIRRRKIA